MQVNISMVLILSFLLFIYFTMVIYLDNDENLKNEICEIAFKDVKLKDYFLYYLFWIKLKALKVKFKQKYFSY